MKNDVIKLTGNMVEVKLSNRYIQMKANEVFQTIMFNIEKGNIKKEKITLNYIGDITHSIMIDRFGNPSSYKDVMEVSKIVEAKFKELLKEDED